MASVKSLAAGEQVMRTIEEATALYIEACRDHDLATAHKHYEAIRRLRHLALTPREALCAATPSVHAYADLDGYGK